jgi:uncharacterized phiE125 gp8 family phage protein
MTTAEAKDHLRVIGSEDDTYQSVTSVSYEDSAGATQTFSTGSYQVITSSEPGYIVPEPGETWPVTETEREAAVTVTFVAGYGDDSTDIPEALIHANKLLVEQLYENRGPVIVGTSATEIPWSIRNLLSNYEIREAF